MPIEFLILLKKAIILAQENIIKAQTIEVE